MLHIPKKLKEEFGFKETEENERSRYRQGKDIK